MKGVVRVPSKNTTPHSFHERGLVNIEDFLRTIEKFCISVLGNSTTFCYRAQYPIYLIQYCSYGSMVLRIGRRSSRSLEGIVRLSRRTARKCSKYLLCLNQVKVNFAKKNSQSVLAVICTLLWILEIAALFLVAPVPSALLYSLRVLCC